MARVYIAAPWKHREKARAAAQKFQAAGHTITELWWDHVDVNGKPEFAEELRRQAIQDMVGVKEADYFVLLHTASSEGKSVEQGFALTWKVPIIGVGNPGEFSGNVFHFLPDYKWVGSVEEAISEVGR